MKNPQLLLALAGLITLAVVAYVELGRLIDQPMFWLLSLGYSLFGILFLITTFRRSGGSNSVGIALNLNAQLVLALSILLAYSGPVAPILLVIWAGQLPHYFTQRAALALVVLSGVLLYLILRFSWHEPFALVTCGVYLGFQIFALASAYARYDALKAKHNLEVVNQQLVAARNLLAQTSKQEERLRISRDLHDILGHQLTALNLQLEILLHKVPNPLHEDVAQTQHIAKELLANIRRVVRDQRANLVLDIRQATQALAARLPQLEICIDGDLALESANLAEQLILCIQEAISNALRHGQANKIVTIQHNPTISE